MREERNARFKSMLEELDEKARRAARKANPMLSDSDTEADEEETSSLNKSTASNFTDDPPHLYSEGNEDENPYRDPEVVYHREDKMDPMGPDERAQESYDTSHLSQPINSDSTRENTDHDHLIPSTCPTVVQSHDLPETKPPDHPLVVKPKENMTRSGKQNDIKHSEKHEKSHKPNTGFGAKDWSPRDKKKKKKKHSKNHHA